MHPLGRAEDDPGEISDMRLCVWLDAVCLFERVFLTDMVKYVIMFRLKSPQIETSSFKFFLKYLYLQLTLLEIIKFR